MWSTSLRRVSWLFDSFSLYVQASTAGMGPENEALSTENPLNSDDLSGLYSVKGAALGLLQVIILVALLFGCYACNRKRRYRHKRRRRRLERFSEESKESNSSNGQVQPIFLDAANTSMPFQSPELPSQSGTYGAIVQSGPYIMSSLASTPYTPSAPNVPIMASTTFPAGVPNSQYRQQPQQPYVPQAQPQDLPPAYHTVFPEKKS